MKKIVKNTFWTLATATAITVPVVTVVVLLKKKDNGVSEAGTELTTDQIKTGLEHITNISSNDDKSIKKLDTASIKPYSAESLRQEALTIGKDINGQPDNSLWHGGISYHAISQLVSFIHALANVYGYDSEINKDTNLTSKQQFLKDKKLTYVDKNNNVSVQYESTDEKVLEFVKGISSKESNISPVDRIFTLPSIGDSGINDNVTRTIFTRSFGFESRMPLDPSDEAVNKLSFDSNGDGTFDANAIFNPYFVYGDEKNPSESVIGLMDKDAHIYKDINVKGFSDKYPTIDENIFKREYAPYIRDMLIKLLKLYKNSTGLIELVGTLSDIDLSPLVDQIKFIISRHMEVVKVDKVISDAPVAGDESIVSDDSDAVAIDPNSRFDVKFTDSDLLEKFKLLNNGCVHWLALKAFYLGLDNSFTTGNIAPFAVHDSWSQGNNLVGASQQGDDSNLSFLRDWPHRNTMWVGLDNNGNFNDSWDSINKPSPKDDVAWGLGFHAAMTPEENYSFNESIGVRAASQHNRELVKKAQEQKDQNKE